jgi:surface antigen
MVDMEDIVSLFLSTLNSESSPQVAEWKFAHVPIGSVISACPFYHSTRHTRHTHTHNLHASLGNE